jgi:DNA-binding MarR family transcriptional regulator
MRLEEEIKQKKFRSEFQKLGVNIIFTHGWLNKLQRKIFNKFELTSTQFNILRILRGQYPNPVSVNLLKDRMLDKRSDASRLVERLRSKGFVERSISKEDRRRADVLISKEGLKLLKKLDKLSDEFDKMLKNLTVKEAKTVNNLLDKLRG